MTTETPRVLTRHELGHEIESIGVVYNDEAVDAIVVSHEALRAALAAAETRERATWAKTSEHCLNYECDYLNPSTADCSMESGCAMQACEGDFNNCPLRAKGER